MFTARGAEKLQQQTMATAKTPQLDIFRCFLKERLIVVAEEIFQAVQDLVCEQQDELQRAKEEICELKHALVDASGNKEIDAQTSHPQGLPGEQQTSKNELNSESSLIQVKLEVCSVQDTETHLQSDTSACSSSSAKITDGKTVTQCYPPKIRPSESLKMDSYISINLVPCDVQLMSENVNSNVTRNQTVSSICVKAEDAYSCPYCETSFDEFSQLESHLEQHKSVVDSFSCHICGKHFKQRVTWKNHMIVHQKIRPFRCKFCGKGFNQKGHLKEHERIHTGEKPFGCSICGKRFTQFNHVRAHLRSHHQDKVNMLETTKI